MGFNSAFKESKNLALKDTLPVLLQHVVFCSKKTSGAALRALRSLQPDSWDEDVKRAATQIYYQLGRRFDSSSRTLASDILLDSRPGDREFRDLLLCLVSRGDPAYEVSQGNPFRSAVFDYLLFACTAG